MKLIVAIIRPEKVEAVQEAVKSPEARLLSIGAVENGREGRAGTYRGLEVRFRRSAMRLEIAVEDWYAETAMTEIIRAVCPADFGQDCDESVFMMPLFACTPSVNRRLSAIPPRDRHLSRARVASRPAFARGGIHDRGSDRHANRSSGTAL
jgi:nitrogen regulatory protein P-II 1